MPSLIACAPSLSGGAFRVATTDEHTLKLSGEIVRDSSAAFEKALSERQIDTVRVDSNGGDAEAAIKIGNMMLDRGLAVIVDGLCGSSCANYILPAASKVTYGPKAAVVYHGDVQSSQESNRAWIAAQSKEVQTGFDEYTLRLTAQEQAFYQRIPDKRVHALNLYVACIGKSEPDVRFWVADPDSLARFGLEHQGYSLPLGTQFVPGMFITRQISEATLSACRNAAG